MTEPDNNKLVPTVEYPASRFDYVITTLAAEIDKLKRIKPDEIENFSKAIEILREGKGYLTRTGFKRIVFWE